MSYATFSAVVDQYVPTSWNLALPNGMTIRSGQGKGNLTKQTAAPDLRTMPKSWVVTQQQRDLFMMINYLIRPPITAAEIRAMPVEDITTLYYNLNQAVGCNDKYRHDNTICKGLPSSYCWDYERQLQERIYFSRQDLWVIQDPRTGYSYRVLMDPDKMAAPECSEKGTAIQALTAFVSIIIGLAPLGALVATAANAAVTIGSTTATALAKRDAINFLNKQTGLVGEIVSGVALAKAYVPVQPINDDDFNQLVHDYNEWQSQIQQLEPYKDQIISWWKVMPWPERVLAQRYQPNVNKAPLISAAATVPLGATPQQQQAAQQANQQAIANAASGYAANWTPYRKFFYSDQVAQAILQSRDGSQQRPWFDQLLNV